MTVERDVPELSSWFSRGCRRGPALALVHRPEPGGNRKIWGFDVSQDGTPRNRRLIYDFHQGRGGDGIRVDRNGNVWVAAGIRTPRPPGETTNVPQGIYVINPQGKMLGRIPIPEDYMTNLAFGGPDLKTLFMTAGTSVYKISVTTAGYAAYPPLRRVHD